MLPESEIAKWKAMAPSVCLLHRQDRAVIYRQGDPLDCLYWLVKGVVRLTRVTPNGVLLTTAILQGGEVFGNALNGDPAEETATCIGMVHLLRIAQTDVTCLLGGCPDFAFQLLGRLEKKRLRTERKLIAFLTQPVRTRLIRILVELALAFDRRCPHGYALEIRLTQQDLADLVHASRPVVTRTMNELRQLGLLDYTRDLICIHDQALQHMLPEES